MWVALRRRGCGLTACGLIFASGASNFQSLVLSMSMTPSIIAWATCTPLGPNSRVSDWAKALIANLPVANEEHSAEPLIPAVADVKISVGGYSPEVALSRSGRQAWAKWNAPLLEGGQVSIGLESRTSKARRALILPIGLHSRHKIFLVQLQKRFANKFASNVEDCSCQVRPLHLGLDLFKRIGNTCSICHIRTYADRLSSSCFYFFD
jgi:hypothetical protein